MDDFPNVLWAYHTMNRIPTGEMTYLLVYGTELVIPVEIGMPSFWTMNFYKETNKIELGLNLDLFIEKREYAEVRQASYKRQVVNYFNRMVKHMLFQPGNLVLREVTLATEELNAGKLCPTWEGPYKVVKVSKLGTCWMEDMGGKGLPYPWNAEHLKK